MSDAIDVRDTPRCPTCGEMMIAPEGVYLCVTALAQSYKDDDGSWKRLEESRHPVLPDEVAYLEAHGVPNQFI